MSETTPETTTAATATTTTGEEVPETGRTPELAWDDEAWDETEKSWAAILRCRQGHYRETVLGLPAGPRQGPKPDGSIAPSKLVVSMLPVDVLRPGYAGPGNFLNADVEEAVRSRLARVSTRDDHWPTSIPADRLLRNLLASQPLVFNLFGNVVGRPEDLLPWVQQLDPDATGVEEVRIVWAPDPHDSLPTGTTFDACVFYATQDGAGGFVAVACTYAENLAASFKPKTAAKHRGRIEALGAWRPGAFRELNDAIHQQLLLHVSLAASLAQLTGRHGHCVQLACADDEEAKGATLRVVPLVAPPLDLRFMSYDDLLATVPGDPAWVGDFTRRYLEDPT
jgi:hypothetical protein